MRFTMRRAGCVVIAAWSLPALAQLSEPDEFDLQALAGLRVMFELHRKHPSQIWPGFDPTTEPFAAYRPGKWLLAFGYSGDAEGFGPYPAHWPAIDPRPRFFRGQHGNLVGQLMFNHRIGSATVPAFPISAGSAQWADLPFALSLVGFLNHEAFHTFQNRHFRKFADLPWEKYPVLDAQKTALVGVEARALAEAIRLLDEGHHDGSRTVLRQFLALRAHRWLSSPPVVAEYEKAQERREGLADYVRFRSMALAKQLLSPGGHGAGEAISVNRLARASIEPYTGAAALDPRKILALGYALGSAQAVLLDAVLADWKTYFQSADTALHLPDLLRKAIGSADLPESELVSQAKERFGFDQTLPASRSAVEQYLSAYKEAQRAFDTQAGSRVEIDMEFLGGSGMSIAGTRWIVNEGRTTLCSRYREYVLQNSECALTIRNTAVMERRLTDSGHINVTFYVPEMEVMAADGHRLPVDVPGVYRFTHVELKSSNARLDARMPGILSVAPGRITIRLARPSADQ